MLNLQKFILENPNWKYLLAQSPYYLKISEKDNYYLFKYSQINSDFSNPIVNESRGIILTKNDYRVVRLAFYKFFNLQEQYAAKLDWDSSYATEKIDGSLISVWYDNNKWHISTNGGIDAYDSPLENPLYQNFGKLFEVAANNSNFTFEELNTNYCYTYELVSPYNKVVIDYPVPLLYHISTRDMTTLEEIEVETKVPKPKRYDFNKLDNYVNLVKTFDSNKEGIVVVDKNYNRVKIKTETYFELHKLRNNGNLNIERILNLIRENEQDEFLSYFPEYKEVFDKVKRLYRKEVEGRVEKIKLDVEEWKLKFPNAPKKWFAQDFSSSPYSTLYFLGYSGNLNYKDWETNKIIKLFRLKDKLESL